MRRILAPLLAALFAAGPALADDSAVHKEGFWTVGRGDAAAKGCMASMNIGETAILIIQVAPSRIDFAIGMKKPMRKGEQGVLVVGDQRFDFEPAYGEKRDLMFLEGVDGRALAAMRKARWMSVMTDGRELVAVSLEKTGVEEALDAAVACSEGQSGWWGLGIGAPATVAGAEESADDAGLAYREPGGVWGILTANTYCIAQAAAPNDRFLQLVAIANGRVGLAIGSNGERLPKARKVRVETDSYRFEFKPEYAEPATYLNSADPLASADVFALRRAKSIRMSADGRALIDVDLEGDGFAEAMDAVVACAAGEKGWWGEGAKPAS